MCGICGFISLREKSRHIERDRVIRDMVSAMVHRGPDDEGFYNDSNLYLGMRRLAIIDLETGSQPQFNEDRSVTAVFNGEIYNYMELKEDLIKKGHRFRSNSDTEVIPHLYEEYGEGFVHYINGMYAIALYDSRGKKVILIRDRMGIKPLYYAVLDDYFVFASEIRSLLEFPLTDKKLSVKAVSNFLTFEYVSAPNTMYENIKKVLPGQMIKIGGGISKECYWHPRYIKKDYGEKELIERIREIFLSAVKYRLISDVPLGVFLSGGVDSTLITGAMSLYEKKIKSFSIGFTEETFNELSWAGEAARFYDTEHCEHLLSERDAMDLIPRILGSLDQPLADASIIPTYLVCMLSRPHVTVALSGDGGDELFLGYDTYKAYKLSKYIRWMPGPLISIFENFVSLMPVSEKRLGMEYKLMKFLKGLHYKPEYGNYIWWGSFSPSEKRNILSERVLRTLQNEREFQPVDFYDEYTKDIKDPLDRINFLDLNLYLQDDLLQKVDNMSMANSLEVRVPFLDHRMVELAVTIRNNTRMKGLKTKYILKKALDEFIPQGIKKRPKIGFDIPLDKWLRGGLRDFMERTLDREFINDTGLFNYNGIRKLMDSHLEKKQNNRQFLWPLIILLDFMRKRDCKY